VEPNSLPATERPGESAAGLWRTFLASTLVLAASLGLLFVATEGGSAFTTETLRRSAVMRSPQPIPDLQVIDASGVSASLLERRAADPRVWIVDFVYTQCASVCLSLGTVYQRLQAEITERGLQDRVGLVSVSFDPARDDAPALQAYASRWGMQPQVWQVLTLARPSDRRRLLDAFGIMVIPAPLGEFEHNAALHVVDAAGRLVRIVDHDDPGRALAIATALTR